MNFLFNHSSTEIYVGTTNSYNRRMSEHWRGETNAISHWDMKKDDIQDEKLDEKMPKQEAIDTAHAVESLKTLNGYEILQTGGQ